MSPSFETAFGNSPAPSISANYTFTIPGDYVVALRVSDREAGGVDSTAGALITITSLLGDYDFSGLVDQADYHVWRQYFGATDEERLAADGNRNGTVDIADYTIWRDNLGAMLPTPTLLGDSNRSSLNQPADSFLQAGDARQTADSFHEQTEAYAGWLVSNRLFLSEVDALRRWAKLAGLAERFTNELLTSEPYRHFCHRWQLAGLASWELPIPQGPIFNGDGLPSSCIPSGITLTVPNTVNIPARFRIQDLLVDIGSAADATHLREWRQILDRRTGGAHLGPARFAHANSLTTVEGLTWSSIGVSVVLHHDYGRTFFKCHSHLAAPNGYTLRRDRKCPPVNNVPFLT